MTRSTDAAAPGVPWVDGRVPTRSYFVCCLPRSGSWLLADGLRQSGVAGRPEEYFWDEFEADYRAGWNVPPTGGFADFLQLVLLAGTTPNRVFGAKLHWEELLELRRKLDPLDRAGPRTHVEALRAFFPRPRFVYLYRSDKVRQAISWFRAGRGGGWYSVVGEPPRPRDGDVEPDWERIALLERILRHQESCWERLFADHGLRPLRIAYEDLTASYEETVADVLRFLDLEPLPGAAATRPRLSRQRDATTEEWVQRYLVARSRTGPDAVRPDAWP
jgi:trehalose 2-sulfotransferase